MRFLDDKEKASLREKIREVESGTHAEIVTVIAETSDGYRYIPLLWAALAALSVPGIYYSWFVFTADGWYTTLETDTSREWIYAVQVLVFLGLCALFQWAPARLWMIPDSVKRQRAARHAREQFFLQNLHQTQRRTGVLIFVSVAEHYVEIIVDSGISDRIDNAIWQDTVRDFIAHVRKGEIARGFDSTLEQCRAVLWQHFPDPDGRPDELPNHLIEV